LIYIALLFDYMLDINIIKQTTSFFYQANFITNNMVNTSNRQLYYRT